MTRPKISLSNFILCALLLTISALTFLKCYDDNHTSLILGAQLSLPQPKQIMPVPVDSFVYMPVAYGAELKMVPNTRTKGFRNGVWYVQMLSYAYQKLPSNLQQDPKLNRIPFCDRDTSLNYSDTLFVCKRMKI